MIWFNKKEREAMLHALEDIVDVYSDVTPQGYEEEQQNNEMVPHIESAIKKLQKRSS